MSKNKDIYGAVCKSQPVPNPGTELTENLPEMKLCLKWHNLSLLYIWKGFCLGVSLAQKQSIKKANFLFFQIFVSLVILTIPTTLWADLISLTVDSGGDTVFRGGVDRLRIIFTVDDSDDEDPYIVEVGDVTGGDSPRFDSRGVIDQGVVSANETVNLFWDGTINDTQLPDGDYTIRVVVDDDDENALTATATLDSSVPRVSGVLANGNPNLLISEGSFIKESLRSIKVTGADDGGDIDLGNRRTTVFLRNERQAVVRGTLTYDDTGITFTLINPLDIPSENGKYTLILILLDKAGNVIQSVREFTFDNVKPSLKRVSTNRGGLIPGGGVSQRLNYVEAVLTDNLEDGVDLFNSTISLTGPDGEIPGEKIEDPGNGKIRWNLFTPLLGRDDSQDGEYTVMVTAVDKAGNPAKLVQISFHYDNQAPRPLSVSPMGSEELFDPFPDTNYYNFPITGFVVTFEGTGIGLDLTGRRQSTQIVFGTPKKSGEGVNVLKGRVVTDDDVATDDDSGKLTQLTYILNQPIVSRDGTQDGHYLTQRSSNRYRRQYQDLQLPDCLRYTAANTRFYNASLQ